MERVATGDFADEHGTKSSLATVCEVGGYASILASIAIWLFSQGDGSAESLAHAERFGIFVGLWAPTFFALSIKYGRKNS